MLETFLFSLLIIAIGILLLCVKVIFGKRFPNTHVSGNKSLTDKGIHCAQAQDAEMRANNRKGVKERRQTK